MLTNIIVKKLSPIWKLKKLPIKLIISKMIAPTNELSKSFSIAFKGTIKILHKTKIMQSPEI